MPNEHTGAHNTGVRGNGGGKLPPDYKLAMVCLGGRIALLGAANSEPAIVAIGVLLVGVVLGVSFKPPGGWLKWLLKTLK